MSKRRATIAIPSLKAVDPDTGPIGRQLTQYLRDAIASGALKPGERLPSTRMLASSLGIARGTVVEAFDQLRAEGYLDTKIGAGTRVVPALVEMVPEPPAERSNQARAPTSPLPPSAPRLAAIAHALAPQPIAPFAIAVPEAGIAPDDTWRRLGNRVRATTLAAPSGYADPLGLPQLRAAIAEHIRRARAVNCTMENIIVTSGTQQGLYVAGRVLLSRGDAVWAENPAYHGLTAVLDDLGMHTHRIPVDEQGFSIEQGMAICPTARAAFVTPSHQYPLGMPLSMARRQALVAWAERNNTWIVEDDYDSELRYAGHPFPAMQGLNPSRVVYLGTFSKVLFPSLRLGYAVAPASLVDAFAGARAILDRHSPTADQHVLAAYMREGFFESHVRRIRALYAERREALLSALEPVLPVGYSIQPSDQGMHILLWLPDSVDDVQVAGQAQAVGLVTRPISTMYSGAQGRPGLMLGFGGFPPDQLREAVASFSQILR
ncbi:MocR-like pyridoxine biosynthesis transcription factor PdxR [Pseudochelatococcus sp. B33]